MKLTIQAKRITAFLTVLGLIVPPQGFSLDKLATAKSAGVSSSIAQALLDTQGARLQAAPARVTAGARSELRKLLVDTVPTPPLSVSVEELIANFADIVHIRDAGVDILTDLTGNRRLFDLARELTDNPSPEVSEAAFWIASAATNERGIEMMSADALYRDKPEKLINEKQWVIPATNQRVGGILEAVTLFEALKRLNAGGVAELATSEKTYSGLSDNKKFSGVVQLAHAYAGSNAPIIVQADHRQLNADSMFSLDENKIPEKANPAEFKAAFVQMTLDEKEPFVDSAKRAAELKKYRAELEDFLLARGYHIDLDISTLVDPILLERLYADSQTADNPDGLSLLMLEVQKRLRTESMEEVGAWIDSLSKQELQSLVDKERVKQYREINKHTAKYTVEQIINLRTLEQELKRQGLIAAETNVLIGIEERHTDWPTLKNKPSEVEGTIALFEMINEGLAQANPAFKQKYGVDLLDAGKISYQTGTAHGVAGREVNTIVFLIHEKLLEKTGVQHGASKLRDDQFSILQKHRVGEVHLATQLQNDVLSTVATEVREMADVMWDMLLLFMNPKKENVGRILKAYLWDAGSTEDALLKYAEGIHGKVKSFGISKDGSLSPWDNYISVVGRELGLDANQQEDRRKITNLIVADSPDVPKAVRSSLKDLVKYLNAPLLPYLTRLPASLEQKVTDALLKWQLATYERLGAQDSLPLFQRYATGTPAPLPEMPEALKQALERSELRIAPAVTPLAAEVSGQLQAVLREIFSVLQENGTAERIAALNGQSIQTGTLFDAAVLFEGLGEFGDKGFLVAALAFRAVYGDGPAAVVLTVPAEGDAEGFAAYRAELRMLDEVNAFLIEQGKQPLEITATVDQGIGVLNQLGARVIQAIVGTASTIAEEIRRRIPNLQIITQKRFLSVLSLDARIASFVEAVKGYYAIARAA